MEYDITETIAKHVRDEADFDQQAEEHAEALRQVCCTDPSLGQWIELGIEFVFSALALDDREFASRLPALADLNKPARQEFLTNLKHHLRECRSCTINDEIERDLNARIERACRENSASLLKQLRLNPPEIL